MNSLKIFQRLAANKETASTIGNGLKHKVSLKELGISISGKGSTETPYWLSSPQPNYKPIAIVKARDIKIKIKKKLDEAMFRGALPMFEGFALLMDGFVRNIISEDN